MDNLDFSNNPDFQDKPVFIDPTVDIGFKILFGDKRNLLNFLNIIFQGRKEIVDLTYRNTERIGRGEEAGTVIFDLIVETSTGEEVVIEMQTSNHRNFKKRMLYYGCNVVSEKAPRGNRAGWGYDIPEVYTIVVMDNFRMQGVDDGSYFHDICLCDRGDGKIFYEGFGFIYLQLINFVKSEAELSTDLDMVFYMLKHLSRLKKLPKIMDSSIFQRFFQLARYAKLSKEDQAMYDISLKRKWDAEVVRQWQIEEQERKIAEGIEKGMAEGLAKGKAEGLAKGKAEGAHQKAIESAKEMKKAGLATEQIVLFTKLTAEEIEKL